MIGGLLRFAPGRLGARKHRAPVSSVCRRSGWLLRSSRFLAVAVGAAPHVAKALATESPPCLLQEDKACIGRSREVGVLRVSGFCRIGRPASAAAGPMRASQSRTACPVSNTGSGRTAPLLPEPGANISHATSGRSARSLSLP
jgi:hypothetical protein